MRRPRSNTLERRRLVGRILASRQFQHAHILKRILRYLCDQREGSPPPKEYEIAVDAMGRPESFDPRADPIVRVGVASIRNRLLAYFATEGKDEPLRLEIPKGEYRVVFTDVEAERAPAQPKREASALARFWRPYFTGQAANLILYTEPLFFRDDKGHYIRDWYVNDPAIGVAKLKERLPGADLGTLSPSYHYLSAGEVHCVLSMTRMFYEAGVAVETRNSRITSWNELRDSNLVLLGSPRTNTFLESLQGESAFVVVSDRVENRRPQGDEQPCYRIRRYLDGKLARMTEYAVVTRRPGLKPGCTITMIAANHGRAIEGAGRFLTLEDTMEKLLARLKLGKTGELPEHFQFLMRVETIDVDDEVVHVECVTHRILKKQALKHLP